MKKPSAIFLGSKPGAAIALEVLIHHGWNVPYVLPKGRSLQALKKRAKDHNIPLVEQENLRPVPVDFIISYMYCDKISPETLQLAKYGGFNFHPAPLPQYAGYGGYNRAILDETEEYSVTCHHLTDKIDAGPIVKKRSFTIDPKRETCIGLEKKAQEEMVKLFIDFCYMAEQDKNLPGKNQDLSKRKWWPHSRIDEVRIVTPWTSKETIEKFARAFWYPPYKGAEVSFYPSGLKVEVVPEVAKKELGYELHLLDEIELRYVYYEYEQSM